MRKPMTLLLVPLLALGLAGCVMHRTPVRPPEGFIFSQYKAPLTIDFDGTKMATKVGSASTMYMYVPLVGLSFAWDRCDIEKAAQAAGLTTVHYADYEVIKVFGVFGKFTVHAHGE